MSPSYTRRQASLSFAAAAIFASGKAHAEQPLAKIDHARERGRVWSLYDFGSIGSKNTDHTSIIQKALSSGEKKIYIPAMYYNIGGAITISASGQNLWGSGSSSVFHNRNPTASAAVPVFLVEQSASDCSLQSFAVRAAGSDKVNPTVGAGDTLSVPYGSAIVVCGDRIRISDIDIYDAWDNGLALVGAPYGHLKPGLPNDPIIRGVRTFNCGCGDHHVGGPGRIGSGINILSASNALIIGCIDRGSNGAVTVDDGAGASGRIVACSSFESARNGSLERPIISAAFYTGSNEIVFDACQAYYPAGIGFWLAGAAQVLGGLVKGANDAGVVVGRDHCMISDMQFKDIGFRTKTNNADVIRVSPVENISDLSIRNVRSYSTQPNLPRYGYFEMKNSYTINADVQGHLQGRVADYETRGRSRVNDIKGTSD